MLLKSTFVFLTANLAYAQIQGPLSMDFQNWLKTSKYSSFDFVRSDLGNYGSYGGRTHKGQNITKTPVIFIHGNSDMALNNRSNSPMNEFQTGWTNSILHFLSRGYTQAEMYATTWGPAEPQQALNQTHNCNYVMLLRNFVEAVMNYTQASKVSIISHSMGVTLGRKLVQGGTSHDQNGSCNVGTALTSKVDTFLGICGANLGLTACYFDPLAPTCNKVNGFYPGTCDTLICPSIPNTAAKYLISLFNNSGTEAANIFVMWSHVDEIIGGDDLVWGEPTSRIKGQKAEWVSDTYLHMQVRVLSWTFPGLMLPSGFPINKLLVTSRGPERKHYTKGHKSNVQSLLQMKDKTAPRQYSAITQHVVN